MGQVEVKLMGTPGGRPQEHRSVDRTSLGRDRWGLENRCTVLKCSDGEVARGWLLTM